MHVWALHCELAEGGEGLDVEDEVCGELWVGEECLQEISLVHCGEHVQHLEYAD